MVIVTTSWDDGHPLDIRLADMLSRYGIRGTFYVSPFNRECAVLSSRELKDLSSRFEIGAHTMTHPRLDLLPRQEFVQEIRGSKEVLEDLTGRPVAMFCYPKGRHNRSVRQAVIDAGFDGARDSMEYHIDLGTDPWCMRTTIQVCPRSFHVRLRHSVRFGNWRGIEELCRTGLGLPWKELGSRFFDKMFAEGGVWHLWGHSWEIEERSLWAELESLLEYVSARDGVQYLSNLDVVRTMTKAPCDVRKDSEA